MQAEDILTATHKLEGSGMTRSQSEAIAETIVAAMGTKIESTKNWLLGGLLVIAISIVTMG